MLDVAVVAAYPGARVRLGDGGLEAGSLMAGGAVRLDARREGVARGATAGVGAGGDGRLRAYLCGGVRGRDGRGRVGFGVDVGGDRREREDERRAPDEDGEGPGAYEVARRRPVEARLAEHAHRLLGPERRDALHLALLALALLPEDVERLRQLGRARRPLLERGGAGRRLDAVLRVRDVRRDFERDGETQRVARALHFDEEGADLYEVAVGQHLARLGGDDAAVERRPA